MGPVVAHIVKFFKALESPRRMARFSQSVPLHAKSGRIRRLPTRALWQRVTDRRGSVAG